MGLSEFQVIIVGKVYLLFRTGGVTFMPMYEFKCPCCGHVVTELCKMGEKGDGLTCQKCGEIGLKRLISGFASLGVPGGNGEGGCAPGCSGNCSGCH